MDLATNIIVPGSSLKDLFESLPNYSAFLSKPKNKKRAERYLKLMDCVVNYADIVSNNIPKQSEDINFISVDQSMNGTGICFSMYAEMSDTLIKRFGFYSSSLNVLFSSLRQKPFESVVNTVLNDIESTGGNLECLDGFCFVEKKYILYSLLSNLDISYDCINKRICFSTKMDMKDTDNFGTLNKISILNSAITFLSENLWAIVCLYGNDLAILKESMEEIDEMNFKSVSRHLDVKTFNRIQDSLKKSSEDLNSSSIIKITNFISKNMENSKPHISYEEISSSVNFVGIRANGISLGACASALSEHTRRQYGQMLRQHDGEKTPSFFQSMFFLTNKSSLKSFCLNINTHLEELAGTRVEVPNSVAESKAPQFILYSLLTGRTNSDSDICDSFCHNILVKNYYDCLLYMIEVCEHLQIIVYETLVLQEGIELKKCKINQDMFDSYDLITSTREMSFDDFDFIMASIVNKISTYCRERFLNYDSVIQYLFSNFSNQINRLHLSAAHNQWK